MSGIICSPKSVRRQKEPVTIMYPLKKKLRTPIYDHPTSVPENDQPLDFSVRKSATPCHEPELRKSKSPDIPSPAVADHPIQAVRNPSPEESIPNNMKYGDSSPDSSPLSPQSSRSVATPSSPTLEPVLPPSSMPSTAPCLASPNLPRYVPEGFEHLQTAHPPVLLPHSAYPHPIAALLPAAVPYIKVGTTPAGNVGNQVSAIGLSSVVPVDSKFACGPGQFSHFSSMRGSTAPESLIGNGDTSMSPLHCLSEKKGTKSNRPFKVLCSEHLPFPFTHGMPDILPYTFTTMRDQELRFAQYAEQHFPGNRRITNGQSKLQVDVGGESTAMNTPKSNETDSNSNSMDSPPSNGSGQSAVTSTAPSTSEQTPKRKNRSLPEELKDEAYWERRRKNNEAAKRSRDARRAKEDEIAMRCSFLQNENVKLRAENETLRLHLRSITGRMNL